VSGEAVVKVFDFGLHGLPCRYGA